MYAGLALGFVAVCAATAAYLATQPTVARGEVLAADVTALAVPGMTGELTCDDRVPITADGAEFHCRTPGQTLVCELKATGTLTCRIVP